MFPANPILALLLFQVQAPVEILVDRWGVPHIYAQNAHDLFYAQGWMAARDRLFQIDAWRRSGVGRWAEVLGPSALPRDRFARLIRYRGDWNAEWSSYSPDAKAIATAFTEGINACIKSLKQRPAEFARAGYDPAPWSPEDVTARLAGLLMMRNPITEVSRAMNVRQFGVEETVRRQRLDPPIPLVIPKGLDLDVIRPEILAHYRASRAAAGASDGDPLENEGSNNWVIHGSRTASGKPILANDPHRSLLIPSLRKTVHLVAPGWNMIGAGEPALPGIALGHNDRMGFGFTIVGIDQVDLVVETLNPANLDEYRDRGQWRRMKVERERIPVRGQAAAEVELRYTVRGPVLYVDRARHKAIAMRWVGAEPGSAGYLAALRLSRARTWREFLDAAAYYKVPSENLVFADREGNIGWIAAGAAPVRKGYDGLLPIPADAGDYDWTGWLSIEQHPQLYNPASGWIATANHNILPPGYPHKLGFEFNAPYRYQRIAEVLPAIAQHKLEDSMRLQQDVTSVAARRFQKVVEQNRSSLHGHAAVMAQRVLAWDARMEADSQAAALAAAWMSFPAPDLQQAADRAWSLLEERLGSEPDLWTWGRLHTLELRHPLGNPAWSRGPFQRPGDATTVNAAGGSDFRQLTGPSYRQILDLSDWDRSLTTNFPGESGDPDSAHYSDLIPDWVAGRYHPLPYSRKAVEAATESRIRLTPTSGTGR